MGFRKIFSNSPARGLALMLLVLSALALAVPAMAEEADAMTPEEEIRALRERIKQLEENQAELYHTLEEKKRPGLMREIAGKITLGGLVELEASLDNNDKDGDTSDLKLATVELGLDADINERVKAHLLLLWEEDDTEPMEMDEGTVTFLLPEDFAVTFGKMYVPFGVYKSHFISDPETLELGETNQTALMLIYGEERLEVSAGAFNGSVSGAGDDDTVDDWFLSFRVVPLEKVILGAYYISDIAETNADITGLATVGKQVAGYGGFALFSIGGVMFDVEYLSAAERFDAADLDADSDGRGDRPRAFDIEVAYDITEQFEVAARFEGNRDFFDFPETQYGVACSYGLFDHVSLSLEYLHGKYSGDAGERDLVTAQTAVEF